MIYTVTFNPSIDYIVSMEEFSLGKTNRTTDEKMYPGGKGINVSTVLTNFGIANIALGFIAGFTGDEIHRLSREHGILCDFIKLPSGNNRINIKLKDFEGTEINGSGPAIPDKELETLLSQIDRLKDGDYLVLAGSIPTTLPSNIYQIILDNLKEKDIKIVVDATKDLLMNTLSYSPFLIKPNKSELEEALDITINSKDDAIRYARYLQRFGARNVIVSLSGDGAIFVSEEGESFSSDVPPGKLVNAVGAGDSMIAGFLAGWENTKDYGHAFHMAVATGSASAFSEEFATKDAVEKLLKHFK